MKPILKVNNLHVYYGSSHILHGASMTLDKGTTTIIGRNGMGKTTFVSAIMGLVPVAEGTVELCGEDITNLPPYKIARKGIGYVPQGRRIFSSLSVDEQLRFVAKNNSDGTGEWSVERVYEFFPRLKERYKQKGTSLSGGEQQMLAIGRALMARPKMILLDEPSLGLAPLIVKEIFVAIKEISKEGTTILFVEQNSKIALNTADRGYVLQTGQMVMHDTCENLLNNENIKKAYLGGE